MHDAFDSAEWNLVLDCCGRAAVPARDEFLSQNYSVHLDETVLQQLVERHRIAPLAYLGIKDLSFVSDAFKASLRSKVLDNQMEVLQVKQFMIRFHDYITSLGYDYLFLKGLVVAKQYYTDPGLRSAVDVDVWVEPAGIDVVQQWLISLGYKKGWELQGFHPRQVRHLMRVGHGIDFTSAKPGLPKLIELHTRIDSLFSDYVFHPAKEKKAIMSMEMGSRTFSVMNHEDQFLYLCVHGTEHAWFRLKWLCDLPRLMQEVSLDWESIRSRSIQKNCLEHLECTILLLHDLMGFAIPDPILASLNPTKYSSPLKYIYAAIASETGVNENDKNRFRHLHYSLKWVRGFPRFSFFLQYLTGPRDWETVRLPEKLFFVYYVMRPFLWLYRRIAVLPIFIFIQSNQ